MAAKSAVEVATSVGTLACASPRDKRCSRYVHTVQGQARACPRVSAHLCTSHADDGQSSDDVQQRRPMGRQNHTDGREAGPVFGG